MTQDAKEEEYGWQMEAEHGEAVDKIIEQMEPNDAEPSPLWMNLLVGASMTKPISQRIGLTSHQMQ